MLQELSISNFALIDSLKIQFNKGLTIMTGETGAGKSIIIDALGLVLGQRASRSFIRQGQKKLLVEAQFQLIPNKRSKVLNLLEDKGIEIDEDYIIIMTREFMDSGKNVCRINGRMVPVSVMKQLSELLIDIHGQHEHQSLLHWENHKELLDYYGGTDIEKLLHDTKIYFNKYKGTKKILDVLLKDERQQEREKDIILFQLDEIKSAQLKEEEDQKLEERRNLLIHSEKIFRNSNKAYDLLYNSDNLNKSIYDQLSESIDCIEKISAIDNQMQETLEQLQSAFIQVEDVAFKIREYRESIEFNPNELDRIEKRLHIINNLKRKYGSTIDEILVYKDELKNKLSRIENKTEEENKLKKEIENHWTSYLEYSKKLTAIRKKIAKKLEKNIIKELNELGMDKVQFKVDIQTSEKHSNEDGLDRIEFLISPNLGQGLRELAKIASGGEISRIMLAFKRILADIDQRDTLIFDEIDTGISGRTAQVVAEKMATLSKKYQIISITHLPQIASMSDVHYLIEKEFEKGTTTVNIHPLNLKDKAKELARMLGGATLTDLTISHAEEIIEMANQYKESAKK